MVGSNGDAHVHFTCASCALAASKTWPVVNPNSFCSTFSGAEAPKVLIPRIAPSIPVYRHHPNVDACSTATRALTVGGKTVRRYFFLFRSNKYHQSRTTTR